MAQTGMGIPSDNRSISEAASAVRSSSGYLVEKTVAILARLNGEGIKGQQEGGVATPSMTITQELGQTTMNLEILHAQIDTIYARVFGN